MDRPEPALKPLFDAASRLPAGPDRAMFLDQACGDDSTLRRRVEALLEANDGAGRFLESAAEIPAGTPVGPFARPHPPADPGLTLDRGPEPGSPASAPRPAVVEEPGAMIGPYKLLQRIGEGGMGTVFMAEQEKPVRRKVALKVIKPGMDSAQVIARFEAERQALALMDHPNIARVLDVGATANGRPFFVMELVKGVPITDYCDRNHLTPRERLELFLPVCRAIQHAHQKGIIHRDIKPSNVMVTLHDGAPEPRVIDFGVAKAIEQRLTERTMFTEYGAIIGTLEYMSPEQAEMGALDVDTRSDIYSLGVLLYELLTGSTPLDKAKLRQAAYSEILRRIREEEPAKPSTRLSDSKDALPSISAQRRMEPARLSKLVRGDLDWIVMKSLDKDRTRRYETANGFARDIQRYLDGDAVEASPPSASYKLRKFARKHRGVLATAGAFAALLVAATALSVGLAYRANKERLRADAARAAALVAESAARGQRDRAVAAEAVANDQRDRALHAEALSRTESGRAIALLRRFADVVERDPDLEEDPIIRQHRESRPVTTPVFVEQLFQANAAGREQTPEALDKLSELCLSSGRLDQEVGKTEDALQAFQVALALCDRRVEQQSTSLDARAGQAEALLQIGIMQVDTGRFPAAKSSLERARSAYDQLAHAEPAARAHAEGLAKVLLGIGRLHDRMGQLDEAIAALDEARSTYDRLVRDEPRNTAYALGLATACHRVGISRWALGRKPEAIAAFERARATAERLARAAPTDPSCAIELAAIYGSFALHVHNSDLPEAMRYYERERSTRERLARDHPFNPANLEALAQNIHNIGFIHGRAGRPDLAMAAYERVRLIRERLVRDDPTRLDALAKLADGYRSLAVFIEVRLHRPAEALVSYEESREILEQLTRDHPADHQLRSMLERTYRKIGDALRALGRRDLAIGVVERAIAVADQLAVDDPKFFAYRTCLADDLFGLGSLLVEAGRTVEAVRHLRRSVAIRERMLVEDHLGRGSQLVVAGALNDLGRALQAAHEPADAVAALDRAGAIFEVHDRAGKLDYEASMRFAANRDALRQLRAREGRAMEAATMGEQAHVARQAAINLDPEATVRRRHLAEIVRGDTPRDNTDRLIMAATARDTAQYRASTRLFAAALVADPSLADDRRAQVAYHAACSAALAAAGRGKDEPTPDAADRGQLRAQALAWLRGELAAWDKSLDAEPAPTPEVIRSGLGRWKEDGDLVSLRDPAELARVPEAERAAFEQLWAEVDRLLARAQPTP